MTIEHDQTAAAGPPEGVDAADLARYERLGADWWDPAGPMGKLHEINPFRMRYLRDRLARLQPAEAPEAAPWRGLTVLDIGCGGGVLSEPMARLGARVTGIDPGATNIGVARQHAERMGLSITYRATVAEDLAAEGAQFDVVVASEVVEHVADRDAFVGTACSLVRPGGLFVGSTINRTAKSFLLAIVGAEYVLRWLPRGTHHWTQFVTPEEFAGALRRAGLIVVDRTGLVFDPLGRRWRLGRDTDTNYFIAARKPVA